MASARALSDPPVPHLELQTHSSVPTAPTNAVIEAVIQMATSSGNPQDSRSPAPLRDTRTQLFVGNLPYRVRWQDLKDLFRRAGTVLRADVSLGPDNRSRGYGNVVLATAEDAGRAIDMLNGYCWQTRILEVRPDRFGASVDETGGSLAIGGSDGHSSGFPPASNPYDDITFGHDLVSSGTGTKTLFVGNLPFHIQWQDLKDLFRAAGAVARADVALGPDGRSRGFGTVSFVTEDGAERARRMFDGYEFNGRQLKVHYDKFSPSAAPVSLVGVSSFPSTLSQYDVFASHLQSLQLESQQPGRRPYEHLSQPTLDELSHPQLDTLRRGDLDSLTSSQIEALLIRANTLSSSRSSNPSLSSSPPTSASLTTPSPALLHTQSLAPTAVHSLAPTPTHPHSLTSSPHLGFTNTNSTSFASLSVVGKNADPLSLKLKTDTKLGNDLHLLSSKSNSRTSSFSSPHPSVPVGSSQAPNYTTTSSGLSQPSFSTPFSLVDGMSFSQRSSFGVSQSQRPSFSSSTSPRPSFGSTSQRPSFGSGSAKRPTFNATSLLQGPFDDEREGQGSISQPNSLGTSRANSGSSTGASSVPPALTRPTSGVGRDTTLTSPSASGGWLSMSSPQSTSPRSAMLAHPILGSEPSNKPQSVWGASKVESSRGPIPTNAEGPGSANALVAPLGSLTMRRSKAQAYKIAEKEKVSPSDSKPTSPSPQKSTSSHKLSQSSSRRQPGPISLPPPSTFTPQHLPMLSPHHPQSPMYHPGYGPPHPVSPLYHPAMNSPAHHPVMSPLHHPSVHPYHHMHYGVMTPHGLPPITPSMPPFTFQLQQKTNGRTSLTERPGPNEGCRQGQTEGRSEAPPPSSPYHHPPHNQVPYMPPHLFSPGIPLSPGIMMPMSPGYPSSVTMVPLTPGGVPLPMTPGVTMTPGAFWPHAPWINPAPGAPVHADDQRHNYGHSSNSGGDYFPPQGEPDDNAGYFPPVSSLANEIFKEGSEFHSRARKEESHSRSSSVCAGMVSPASESTQEGQQQQTKSDRARGITRTTSVHNDGKGSGTPKRASLTHRADSDPIVPSLSSSGERQS